MFINPKMERDTVITNTEWPNNEVTYEEKKGWSNWGSNRVRFHHNKHEEIKGGNLFITHIYRKFIVVGNIIFWRLLSLMVSFLTFSLLTPSLSLTLVSHLPIDLSLCLSSLFSPCFSSPLKRNSLIRFFFPSLIGQ